jgi:hypothetical protein
MTWRLNNDSTGISTLVPDQNIYQLQILVNQSWHFEVYGAPPNAQGLFEHSIIGTPNWATDSTFTTDANGNYISPSVVLAAADPNPIKRVHIPAQ